MKMQLLTGAPVVSTLQFEFEAPWLCFFGRSNRLPQGIWRCASSSAGRVPPIWPCHGHGPKYGPRAQGLPIRGTKLGVDEGITKGYQRITILDSEDPHNFPKSHQITWGLKKTFHVVWILFLIVAPMRLGNLEFNFGRSFFL